MLPQGIFSVAVATVLFPTLSRQAARRDGPGMRRAVAIGMRQINLLLIPAVRIPDGARNARRAADLPARSVHHAIDPPHLDRALLVRVQPPVRRPQPAADAAFFALKRPWIPTGLAAINIVVDIIVSVGLYRPLGIAGLVIGTFVANAVMTALQLRRLRAGFNGRLEGHQTTMVTARIIVASVLLAAASWIVWYGLDRALGRTLPAQLLSVARRGGGRRLHLHARRAAHGDPRGPAGARPGAGEVRADRSGRLQGVPPQPQIAPA